MVLTNIPRDPLLDLDPWIGQRACTFRFYVTAAGTGERLGEVHPIRGASLTHDSGRTIKRSLELSLGTADTAAINPLTDRISLYMVFRDGATYPLGKYMFTAPVDQEFTSGTLSSQTLNDEMFIVDQPISKGLGTANTSIAGLIRDLLNPLPITYRIEPTEFNTEQSWAVGTTRGGVLESLSLAGDYLSPWFDNEGVFRMIRSFDPAGRIADLDLDQGHRVLRDGIVKENDLVTAPNTFLVIGAGGQGTDPLVGRAQVPDSAPNSVLNRGFEIVQVLNLSVNEQGQANAVARGLAERRTILERVNLTTPPDPRHDSYNVIRWQGENWLELSWSMALVEGGQMNHLLRRAYRA